MARQFTTLRAFLALMLLLGGSATLRAQHLSQSDAVTLWSSTDQPQAAAGAQAGGAFTESFEAGIPAGWAVFGNEHSGGESVWAAFNETTLGNVVRSRYTFDIPSGAFAEDYIATPRIRLTSRSATLSFLGADQFATEYDSEYSVLVSQTAQRDPAAYTKVATFTEKDFKTAAQGGTRRTVDLSAYAGKSVYIAFRHRANNEDTFYLDDIEITGELADPPFTERFEAGIPAGWAVFGNKHSGDESVWAAFTEATLGEVVRSRYTFSVPAGELAEDYIATPLVELTPGNASLSFLGADQFSTKYNSVLDVLVSQTLQRDPAAYTVVATFTEKDFKQAKDGGRERGVDLSAYAGKRVYIAFRHRGNNDDSIFLDNIEITGEPAGAVASACSVADGYIVQDDGTAEGAYGGNATTVRKVTIMDRFTPASHPATLESFCFAPFINSTNPYDTAVEVVAYAADGPNGSPGTLLGTVPRTIRIPPGAGLRNPNWLAIDASGANITVTSGDVYVGVRWAPADPNVLLLADQTSRRPAGFADGFLIYERADGTEQWQQIGAQFRDYRAMFIRPKLSGQNVAAASDEMPAAFALQPNYPNPFSSQTTISFSLPEASHVRLSVYDITGRLVSTPLEGERPAGTHAVGWSADGLAAGVYFYHLEAGAFRSTQKMIVLR